MQETANKQKRITLKTLHEMLDGMSVDQAEKVHLLFMAYFRFPPSPLSQEGLHLSLYSLSSGEGKIENFENPSFSKFLRPVGSKRHPSGCRALVSLAKPVP